MMKILKSNYQIILFVLLIGFMIFLDQSNIEWSKNTLASAMIENSILRFFGGVIFIVLLCSYGYGWLFKFTSPFIALLVIIPGVIIAINNFPISAYFNGRTTIIEPTYNIYLFLVESLSVGFFEEIIFRGLVLVLLIEKLGKKSNGLLKAIIISASIFSLIHIINIFDGASIGNTVLQIGYSFLIGLLFAVLYLKTKNLWLIMILHALYNFFGQVMFQVGTVTNRYDTITIVLTITFGILTAIYGVYLYIMIKDKPFLPEV
jgi:membrane protease YdiL (CAAX protease family)